MEKGFDVIYQMPFVHDGIRGIADFLIRVDDVDRATASYEPVDAKLTRIEGKPGHVLQLCFYADAIDALDGQPRRARCTSGWVRAPPSRCGSKSSALLASTSPPAGAPCSNEDEIGNTRPEPVQAL